MAEEIKNKSEMEGLDGDFSSKESLALQLVKDPDMSLFRPSLADDRKIGFFSLDRSTQTEKTEVTDINELTDAVQQLLEDSDTMKRDINFARSVMQAEFEAKLQQKSIDMYVKLNDKLAEMEKMHTERVDTVRRAFKQQLADAIARIHNIYTKDMDRRLNREKGKKDNDAGKWGKKVKELQGKIQQNEALIEMLQQQLADNQSRRTSIEGVNNEDQLDELREEIETLDQKLRQTEREVDDKEETIRQKAKELEDLNDALEKERLMVEQLMSELKYEKDEFTSAAEKDKMSSERTMENHKLAMQRSMEDYIKPAREQAIAEVKQKMQKMQDEERQKYIQLMEEKRLVEQLLAKEKAKRNERMKEQLELEDSRRNEQKLLAEIPKLKKEVDRVHKMWEKKFAILQQSLHALKDESFLRQTMQRQAAQLHQASISFAQDEPLAISPRRVNAVPPIRAAPKKVGAKERTNTPGDFLSYTVSARSGRETTPFSTDENQVMSDTEQELPDGIVPLPAPPLRNLTDCSEASRHGSGTSAKPRLVVLPPVTAQ